MPDLRTALKEAIIISKEKQMVKPEDITRILNEWDDDDKPLPPEKTTPALLSRFGKVTNNISRVTFNAIRDNPNKISKDICNILKEQGYNVSSVSSLIYQMIRNGMVARELNGCLSTTLKEYHPIKNLKELERIKAKTGIASLTAPRPVRPIKIKTLGTPAPKQVNSTIDIDALLSTLTLKDAVALFVALQDMFNLTRKA